MKPTGDKIIGIIMIAIPVIGILTFSIIQIGFLKTLAAAGISAVAIGLVIGGLYFLAYNPDE